MSERTAVIIVAAGSGSRMNASTRKALLHLRGRPLFLYAIETMAAMDEVVEVVLVLHPDDVDVVPREYAAELDAAGASVQCVAGGRERSDSVQNGLNAVSADVSIVLVHDAARPLATEALVRRVIASAISHGAAVPGTPVADTLKRVDADGFGGDTVPREGLFRVQTPQGFDRRQLAAAYAAWPDERGNPTDESQVVEHAGRRVKFVAGEEHNLKITTPTDLEVAESWLAKRSN